MKKAYPFILSVAVIAACLTLLMASLNVGEGVSFVVREVPESERMRGNDSEQYNKIELFKGETVNINTADEKRLALLPGIGEGLSAAIVEYREQNGCFECIEDIMKVEGIGAGRFEEISGLITVGEMSDENFSG